ncbi:hypothetical protein [Blastococcus brunescens]|uniref:Uncharacterized protein n=1 Tax=Blastococcus brunescens TaxID=1564165 RepID=A0ABZ1B0P8_9ACTN|nr:hypothetical protein [Blastococcus sp. BMG 8361]WRL62605.1 hypothetical protein U6N30_21955 [Blastococcus sp. BMG 8361]
MAAPAGVLVPPGAGKLKYLAGSESGMGAFITDTNPEDIAEQLRTVDGVVEA